MSKDIEAKKEQIRQAAINDLEFFIKLVHPNRVLSHCHIELIRWWTRPEAKSHQLVLLPRDHQKSALVAYRVAWEITRNPAIRVLYLSATSTLAIKQLGFIQDILTSDIYRFYWPEMVHKDVSKRKKWTETEISVDHPLRKEKYVRDATVFVGGLTTTITGLHCDIAVLDDVVVDDNAYTPEGRAKVASQASYLASIAGTNGRVWAVGTRYHPVDYYDSMMNMRVDVFNEDGATVDSYQLYELHERQVETRGDGTGEFLWPRQKTASGDWFGFNREILAIKKAQYDSPWKFRAQYYNDPNDHSTASITRDMFQYYEPKLLRQEGGRWFYKDSRLNVFAAVDFAYSTSKAADYTAVAVIGVDSKHNYYILEIERFKTNKISDYFDVILRLHTKWDFRKIRAEVTAAQDVIVKDLKENYIKAHGLALSVEESRPTRQKEERIEAILQPKYSNRQIWHYRSGNCNLLEEELVLFNPPHDDMKDAVASAIETAIVPTNSQRSLVNKQRTQDYIHPRFGGVAH